MLNLTYPSNRASYAIIPLVYDEALSYWQQLRHMSKTINSIIKYLEYTNSGWMEGDKETLEAAKDYANSIVSGLENEFDSLVARVDAEIKQMKNENNKFYTDTTADIENKFFTLKQEINGTFGEIFSELVLLWNAMNYLFFQQDKKFEEIRTALQKFIEESVAQTTGASIKVINPVYGSVTTLNRALADLMEYLSQIGGITRRQYDSLHITRKEYDALKITKRDYRLKAYFIFYKKLVLGDYIDSVNKQFGIIANEIEHLKNETTCYNPYTGAKTSVSLLASCNAGRLAGAPTMLEYEEMERNFNQYGYYNSMQLTMRDYENYSLMKYLINQMTTTFECAITGQVVKDVIELFVSVDTSGQSKSPTYLQIQDNFLMGRFFNYKVSMPDSSGGYRADVYQMDGVYHIGVKLDDDFTWNSGSAGKARLHLLFPINGRMKLDNIYS